MRRWVLKGSDLEEPYAGAEEKLWLEPRANRPDLAHLDPRQQLLEDPMFELFFVRVLLTSVAGNGLRTDLMRTELQLHDRLNALRNLLQNLLVPFELIRAVLKRIETSDGGRLGRRFFRLATSFRFPALCEARHGVDCRDALETKLALFNRVFFLYLRFRNESLRREQLRRVFYGALHGR